MAPSFLGGMGKDLLIGAAGLGRCEVPEVFSRWDLVSDETEHDAVHAQLLEMDFMPTDRAPSEYGRDRPCDDAPKGRTPSQDAGAHPNHSPEECLDNLLRWVQDSV
ncbi:hypothetical protein [Pontibacter sp. G13]|uniref:hypothetical protein n=1 Tax=Pontibacter sp. G13 TaxID=3074898 RepID=UPI00288B07DF|nr:hypothetical protein [Pontibacter sp. G13]WNJ16578.1 hypothetical protein RJD25_17065 [Pontibacter sp. G13]